MDKAIKLLIDVLRGWSALGVVGLGVGILLVYHLVRNPGLRLSFWRFTWVCRNNALQVTRASVMFALLAPTAIGISVGYTKAQAAERAVAHDPVSADVSAKSGPTRLSAFWWGFAQGFLIVLGITVISDTAQTMLEGSKLATKLHGGRWRKERKTGLAALLTRSCSLRDRGNVTPTEAQAFVTDLLDLLVLHVRDYRGNYRRTEVFANLLLLDGDAMWVVARDATLHTDALHRQTPAKHEAAKMLAAQAMAARTALSIGDVRVESKHTPHYKPYRSILAIPVFFCSGGILGCVSIDSSRPYFFTRTKPLELESELETNLAPYLVDLALFLEACVGKDTARILEVLRAGAEASTGHNLTSGDSR